MSDPRIISVELDEATILRRNADIEQFAGVPSTDFEPNPDIPRDREDELEDELDSLRKARRDGLGALAPVADLISGIEDIFNNAMPSLPWLLGLVALALLSWLGLRLAESRGFWVHR